MLIHTHHSSWRGLGASHRVYRPRPDRSTCERFVSDGMCPADLSARRPLLTGISVQESDHGDRGQRRPSSSPFARSGGASRSRTNHRVRPGPARRSTSRPRGTSSQSARGRPSALDGAADRKPWAAVTSQVTGEVASPIQRPSNGHDRAQARVSWVEPWTPVACELGTSGGTISLIDGRCSAMIGGRRARQASPQ
jgi:hypothetical protein